MVKEHTISKILAWQSGLFTHSNGTKAPMLDRYLFMPDQVAYLVDCQTGELVDSIGDLGKLLGYNTGKLRSVEQLYDPIVNDDIGTVLTMTWQVLDWIFHRATGTPGQNGAQFKYRVKSKKGTYVQIMRQTLGLGVEDKITHTLGILTDISRLDNDPIPRVAVVGPGKEHFQPVFNALENYRAFSKREIEILKLLAAGMSSKEISDRLFISRHTVDTHRRNMLDKAEVANTGQLLYRARNWGVVP